ncbi:MAG: hypothetical protein HY817_03110 [Candidatus Abawacabacteria bacterium]|nr:hypothetical protein [Candidatus Abawacabacteria bacterium]
MHDAQMLPVLMRTTMRIIIGDSTYGAHVMREKIWEKFGILVLAPPHYTQKTQLMTWWQWRLLNARSKIESVFDYLKEHLHLVSSFPRSLTGYFLHYMRILLTYQFLKSSPITASI